MQRQDYPLSVAGCDPPKLQQPNKRSGDVGGGHSGVLSCVGQLQICQVFLYLFLIAGRRGRRENISRDSTAGRKFASHTAHRVRSPASHMAPQASPGRIPGVTPEHHQVRPNKQANNETQNQTFPVSGVLKE